jgi:hypothetical protein
MSFRIETLAMPSAGRMSVCAFVSAGRTEIDSV